MQANSNPQEPTITPTPTESSEVTTTASKAPSQAATGEPKPTAANKPKAKQPTRPTAGNTAQTAEKAQGTAPAPAASARGPREGSTMWAILQVLEAATQPLSAKEIYAQIVERKLASGLKGHTPDQSVAAALAVAAKKGRYVERAAPGKFQILEERP